MIYNIRFHTPTGFLPLILSDFETEDKLSINYAS